MKDFLMIMLDNAIEYTWYFLVLFAYTISFIFTLFVGSMFFLTLTDMIYPWMDRGTWLYDQGRWWNIGFLLVILIVLLIRKSYKDWKLKMFRKKLDKQIVKDMPENVKTFIDDLMNIGKKYK